jgi:hypothetical protein
MSANSTPATDRRKGEKIGWLGGWLGSFFWLFLMGCVFVFQGRWFSAAVAMGLFVLAVVTIIFAAPWRHPHTPYRKLMGPVYLILFAALVFGIWTYRGFLGQEFNPLQLLSLTPILLPLILMWNKTWATDGRGT